MVGILCSPLPSGALMFIALAVTIFTNPLSFKAGLSGFASGTVWMIFSAYLLSLGFVQSGLSRRIAYKTLSLFGGSSLGIAYSLGIADLILAPAMPSVTARSGGIILPISKSIDQVLDSEPGPKQKRLGEFLTMTCFQFTPITGAMFMTGMTANPLCATLAKEGLGIELTWVGWFWAAVVPAMVCFVVMPLLSYKILNPELKRTPEVKKMGREELKNMGPMSAQEIKVAIGFVLALLGWGTTMWTGLNANAIGIGLAALLFAVYIYGAGHGIKFAVELLQLFGRIEPYGAVDAFKVYLAAYAARKLYGAVYGFAMAACGGGAVGCVGGAVHVFKMYIARRDAFNVYCAVHGFALERGQAQRGQGGCIAKCALGNIYRAVHG